MEFNRQYGSFLAAFVCCRPPRLRWKGALFFCAVASSVLLAQYSPNLRIDSDLNDFLRRIATRYQLALPGSFYSQPMRAADVLRFLDRADSLDAEGRLTPQESFRLKRARAIVSGRPNLFTAKRPQWGLENHINSSFLGELDPSYGDSAAVRIKGMARPELTGSVGRLSYFSSIDVWTEVQTDTVYQASSYQPFDGIPYNLFGRADSSADPAIRSSDMLRAGLTVSLNRIDFETAIDYMRSGPAVFYPLTFSGYAPPLTYFRTHVDLAVMEYFHSFGLLRCQKDRDKFFYAHRLQIPIPALRAIAGINESIVGGSTAEMAQIDSLRPEYYGIERHFEWVYMIPFVPYAFAEHYTGDRDNSVLSLDLSLFLPKAFRWYAEFFVDDITTPWTIFGDDWGNKWALTAGVEYFGVVFEKDIHGLVEYSRVEPWVYTHFYGGSHSYTHFGQSLGSALGPNSAGLVFLGELSLHRAHSLGVLLRNTRMNTSVRGGSIDDVFQKNSDVETKEFLGDGTRRENTAGVFWRMTPFGIFALSALLEYDTDGEVRLEARGRILF